MFTPRVTRLVVIDSDGRVYDKWDQTLTSMSLQDGGRTLKIFLKDKETEDDD